MNLEYLGKIIVGGTIRVRKLASASHDLLVDKWHSIVLFWPSYIVAAELGPARPLHQKQHLSIDMWVHESVTLQ